MSRFINIDNITVSNANNAENFNGKNVLQFVRCGGFLDDRDPQNIANEAGYVVASYSDWGLPFSGTILNVSALTGANNMKDYWTSIGFEIFVGGYNRGMRFRNKASSGNGDNGPWRIVIDDTNVNAYINSYMSSNGYSMSVSLEELEKILSLESKEERLNAIAKIKTDKLKLLDKMQNADSKEIIGGG